MTDGNATDNNELEQVKEKKERKESKVPNHVTRSMQLRTNPNLQDKYYGSEEAINAVVDKFIDIFGEGATVCDCCAGQDTPLARILSEKRFTVIENDLHNGGEDFLQMKYPPSGVAGFITSFPFMKVTK